MRVRETDPEKRAERKRQQTAERQRRFLERRAEQAAKGLPPAPPIPTMPSRERWNALQEQARVSLQTMVEEMQSYYDDRSEVWQESDKGTEFQERIDALDALLGELDAIT